MGKLVKTYLLAFLVAFVSVSVAQAAKTKFTNVEVTGTLDVDGAMTTGSCSCSNISSSTLTSTSITATSITVSTITVSGAQGIRTAASHVTAASTVPAAAGILATDSSWNLYISTGTGAGAWVKVGAQ